MLPSELLMLLNAENLAVAAAPCVLMRLAIGLRSLATRFDTKVGMSKPDPTAEREDAAM